MYGMYKFKNPVTLVGFSSSYGHPANANIMTAWTNESVSPFEGKLGALPLVLVNLNPFVIAVGGAPDTIHLSPPQKGHRQWES